MNVVASRPIHVDRTVLSRVIEAAYRLELEMPSWLDGVGRALAPAIDGGLGVAGWCYRVDEGVFTWSDAATPPGPWASAVQRSLEDAELRAWYLERACSTLHELLGAGRARSTVYEQHLAPLDIADFIVVHGASSAVEPGGTRFGCVLGAAHRAPIALPDEDRDLLTTLAAQIGAGLHLRAQVGDGCDEATMCAIPSVEPSPREQARHVPTAVLRQAAIGIDAVRRRDQSPNEADLSERWRAFVAASWPVVDQFDYQGRRFLIARREEAPKRGHGLTVRENQVALLAAAGYTNKVIAFELGLTESAVASFLSRAARKLGVHSRVELVRSVRARGGGVVVAPGSSPPNSVPHSAVRAVQSAMGAETGDDAAESESPEDVEGARFDDGGGDQAGEPSAPGQDGNGKPPS